MMRTIRQKTAGFLSAVAVGAVTLASLTVPAFAAASADEDGADVAVVNSEEFVEGESGSNEVELPDTEEAESPSTQARETTEQSNEDVVDPVEEESEWVDYQTEFGGDPSVVDQTNYFADMPLDPVAKAVTSAAAFDLQRAIANWTPGYIMSDRAMYTPSLMSEAEVKTFIQSKGANCKSSSSGTCLKDKTASSLSLKSKFDGKGYGCKPLTLPSGTKSWTAVKAVGDACGINPQVLLVFIQKESSGLTTALSNARWDKMMGMGCPDGQPCKTEYAGFTNQLYYGADALTSYRYRDFRYNNAAKAGTAIAVPYSSANPTGCGSQTFVIKNQATASLYTYNPAVSSKAAVAAYPGYTSNPCDSWGQRNVYMFMLQWFPQTMSDHPGGAPQDFTTLPKPTVVGVPFVGSVLSVGSGSASSFKPAATSVSYQWLREGVAISGANSSTYRAVSADMGKKITVRVTGSKQYYNTASVTSSSTTIRGTSVRLSGSDRYNTNLAVNKQTMVAGKPVFVATGDSFADALSVGPAVSVNGGSLVLAKHGQVSAETLTLLKSKKPSAIYVIGGAGAVSDSAVSSLKSATGVTPQRIGGADRYETSAAILSTFFKSGSVSKVFVATGADYPDALTASAAGGALKMPVLLVEGKSGTAAESALTFLRSKGTSNLVVVGGATVVTGSTASSLAAAIGASKVERLSGSDRYATNSAVNGYVDKYSSAATGIWVATGYGFADALSAAVPAGSSTQRLVLASQSCMPKQAVASWIDAPGTAVTRMTLVGGSSVLAESVRSANPCR